MRGPEHDVSVVVLADETDAVREAGDACGNSGDGGEGEVGGEVEVVCLGGLGEDVATVGDGVVGNVDDGNVVLGEYGACIGAASPGFALVVTWERERRQDSEEGGEGAKKANR